VHLPVLVIGEWKASLESRARLFLGDDIVPLHADPLDGADAHVAGPHPAGVGALAGSPAKTGFAVPLGLQTSRWQNQAM
jgi:hypothetical protein